MRDQRAYKLQEPYPGIDGALQLADRTHLHIQAYYRILAFTHAIQVKQTCNISEVDMQY